MAQGAVAAMAINGNNGNGINGTGLTADELREILELERIVQFKDAVLAGAHPRIKIPAHLIGKQSNATRNFSSPTTSSTPSANPNSTNGNSQNSQYPPPPAQSAPHIEEFSSSSYPKSPNPQRPASSAQISKSTKSEIDPIFLQKSDDLIKAEMNLQRMRLERSLRDQIELQRQAAKALLQTSESLPNFDISEVLSKALALVNPPKSTGSIQTEPAMAGDTPADDSFDDNTFYSSQHDSSDWSNSSQGQKEPVEVQSHGLVSVDGRPGQGIAPTSRVGDHAITSLSTNNELAANIHLSQSQAPSAGPHGLANLESSSSGVVVAANTSRRASGQQPAVHSKDSTTPASQQRIDPTTVQNTTDQLLRQAFEQDPPPPLIRAHNLSPIAPQPARVSPLATAREPPILRVNILADEAAPAQVAALRNQPTGLSSTDSSPKGTKSMEKKRNKKKKRKVKDNTDNTPDSPYIKPEPHSPSPYSAVAPLPRPQKRQRQSGQYAAELNYDEPRYDSGSNMQTDQPTTGPYGEPGEPREPRQTQSFERIEERYEPEFRRPEPAYRRIIREDDGFGRASSDNLARRLGSPSLNSLPYASTESRPTRAASHAYIVRSDRERSRSPIMHERTGPPPRQPYRILRDEYGREYIDPASLPTSRESVALPGRYREEVVYERPPMRAISSRAVVETYDDDGNVYRRASPAPVARRVITQPGYAMAPPLSEYRQYREREYSVRPMGPPGEDYVPVRAPERRQYDEPPREYISRDQIASGEERYGARAPIPREREPQEYSTRAMSVLPEAVRYEVRGEASREYSTRAPSVRPEPIRYETREEAMREYGARAISVRPQEHIRYEVPREYVGRLGSVRPEAPLREYSVRPVDPLARREEMAAPPREYARREVMPQSQREFSVRPAELIDRREEMAPPKVVERYYEDVRYDDPRGRDEVATFVERPRARESSVIVYADDDRRQVYR